MLIAFYAFLVVAAFLAMEGVAWATHKYIMHGFLWRWHEDHHRPYTGIFEKNDLFGVVFSTPAIAFMMLGLHYRETHLWLFFIGCGITCYGAFYVIFHDIIVHRRIKIKHKATTRYMKRLIRAHKIHHKVSTKYGAESFGFLYAGKKYEASEWKEE